MIEAARYLGVAPWELVKQPYVWFRWAMDSKNAELIAEKNRSESKIPIK